MATPPEDLTGANKYIANLDSANPPGTDQSRRFGDDHLRGVKNVLRNTFPSTDGNGLTGPVDATHTDLGHTKGARSNLQEQIDAVSAGAAFTFWVTGMWSDGFVYLNTQAGDGFTANTVRYFGLMVANAAPADRNAMAKMAVSINDGAFGAPGDAFFINTFGAGGLSDGWKSWANQPNQTKITFRFWAPSVIPNDTNWFTQFNVRTVK